MLKTNILTFKDYINNPNGTGDKSLNIRVIKDSYAHKYINMLEKHGDPKYAIAKTEDGFYIYIKMPSESIEKLFYDIVIQVYKNPDGSTDKDSTIKNYGVRFFSNAASFVYTYAYTYNDNGLFITDLENKFEDKTPLNTAPSTTNRSGIIGFDKFLFMASKFVEQELTSVKKLEELSSNVSMKDFTGYIDTFEDKLHEYRLKQRAQRVKQKSEELKDKKKVPVKKREKLTVKNPNSNTKSKEVKRNSHKVSKIKGTNHKVKSVSKIKPKRI